MDSFAPRPLIFKLQQEVLKFNDICMSWSSPETDWMETNFVNFRKLKFWECPFFSIVTFRYMFNIPLQVSPSGFPPSTCKIGLSPYVPPLFCPLNVDFVIFMQFWAILPKMPPPTTRIQMGNPALLINLFIPLIRLKNVH